MNANWLAAPVALPMITGILLIFMSGKIAWQRRISVVSTASGLVIALWLLAKVRAGGIAVLEVGAFDAPFGIVMVGDLLGLIMVAVTWLVALAALLHSFATIDKERESHYYYAFIQFLLMGLGGSFLTGDLFNLFVWFEVMLISSYILLTLGGRPFQLQEGFKYVVINILASALFLVAVAVLYQAVGSVNMADVAQKFAAVEGTGMHTLVAFLFLAVFGLKAAIFPLHFWLPASYDAPPSPVAALFGGLLTKAGVYGIMRVFTLIFVRDPGATHTALIWIAGFTLVVGVIMSLAQFDFRRIISYHVIGHIGFMLMGVGIMTPLALAGSVFYMIHDVIVKTGVYFISGTVEKLYGTTDLRRLCGLSASMPGLTLLFFVSALSFAGVPPMSGFFGKLMLVQGAYASGHYWIGSIAIAVSLLILYSMIQIYRSAFWGSGEDRVDAGSASSAGAALLAPTAVLVLISVAIGLGAQYVSELALDTARQLLDPEGYIRAVLGLGVQG